MGDAMNVDSAKVTIDEDLHSRQLAVYGKESMKRMANADILIIGVKGLGVEVGALRLLSVPSTRPVQGDWQAHTHACACQPL